MDKEKLKTFIRLLQKVHTVPPLVDKCDLGLIVKESKTKISPDEILDEIKKIVAIGRIVYDKSVADEDVIEKIIEAFKRGEWIFLETKKDIGSILLNQLKHLANNNILQLIDYQGKDLVEIKIPENSRIIIFAEREFIENKISYPHFYRLFGPTLSL